MAAVSITTAQDFVDLLTGVYGYGTAADPLAVTLDENIDMASASVMVNPGNVTWYMDFDGKGNRIKNFTYNNNDIFYLIGALNGRMHDVIFEDMVIDARQIYVFNLSTVSDGNGYENVYVSGDLQSTGGQATLFSRNSNSSSPNNFVTGCSFKGSLIATTNAYLFVNGSYGCTAVLTHIGNGSRFRVFDRATFLGAAFVDETQGGGTERSIFADTDSKYCTAVVKSASGTVQMRGSAMYYDSEIAAAGNVTFGTGTGETTAHLKDVEYMSEVLGFPAEYHQGVAENISFLVESPNAGLNSANQSRQMRINNLCWGWNIRSIEIPVIPTGTNTRLEITIQVVGDSSTAVTYTAYEAAGDITKYQHIDTANAVLVKAEPTAGNTYLFSATKGQSINITVSRPSSNCNFYIKQDGQLVFGGSVVGSGSSYRITSTLEFDYDPIFTPNVNVDEYLTYGDIVTPLPTGENIYVFTANGLVAAKPYIFTGNALQPATMPIIYQ